MMSTLDRAVRAEPEYGVIREVEEVCCQVMASIADALPNKSFVIPHSGPTATNVAHLCVRIGRTQ
jgi:hypothetical protein